jgi:hypothetical protein
MQIKVEYVYVNCVKKRMKTFLNKKKTLLKKIGNPAW